MTATPGTTAALPQHQLKAGEVAEAKIGGADVWNAITYDEVTSLVIFGTAGAGVDYGELSSIKVSGDKLFSGCIIAVNADTGEYAWHFKTSAPGMQTENNHILMADLTIGGEKRHVAMTAQGS